MFLIILPNLLPQTFIKSRKSPAPCHTTENMCVYASYKNRHPILKLNYEEWNWCQYFNQNNQKAIPFLYVWPRQNEDVRMTHLYAFIMSIREQWKRNESYISFLDATLWSDDKKLKFYIPLLWNAFLVCYDKSSVDTTGRKLEGYRKCSSTGLGVKVA